MALPEQIVVSYMEEEAGYLSVRPVTKQTFLRDDLIDMVVSVAGKDAGRVQRILQAGAVTYHGYHYTWEPIRAGTDEVAPLLADYPDDDASRPFDLTRARTAIFEIGGGAQSQTVEILRADAARKKWFARQSPWEVLVDAASQFPARYDSYSYDLEADLFRITLPFEGAQQTLAAMMQVASRSLRHRWGRLRPPAAITFVIPRD